MYFLSYISGHTISGIPTFVNLPTNEHQFYMLCILLYKSQRVDNGTSPVKKHQLKLVMYTLTTDQLEYIKSRPDKWEACCTWVILNAVWI